MKKLLLILCLSVYQIGISQTYNSGTISTNQLSVSSESEGSVKDIYFKNLPGKPLNYLSSIWLGGIDQSSGNLHVSAQTYRQSGSDFSPGPISNDANSFSRYNAVYPILKTTVDSFRTGLYAGVIPPTIANWPGNGDTAMGEAYFLAPFVDVDLDGVYDPDNGDYPCMRGDASLFSIFNDDSANAFQSLPLGVEVHCLTYVYNDPGILDSSIFFNYKIYNRSQNTYLNTYISNFNDYDIGRADNDILGSDVLNEGVFCYNATSFDNGLYGFGLNPPAVGTTLLKGFNADINDGVDNNHDGCIDGIRDANGNCVQEDSALGIFEEILMSNSIYYNNTYNAFSGNPDTSVEFYNYQKALWRNGFPLVAETPCGPACTANGDGFTPNGSGFQIPYCYPGNSYDTNGVSNPITDQNWFESPANLGDKRILLTMGPQTFYPNEVLEFDLAFTVRYDSTNNSLHYDYVQRNMGLLNEIFDTLTFANCENEKFVSVSENIQKRSRLNVFPNPSSEIVTIEITSEIHTLNLFSSHGMMLEEIQTTRQNSIVINVSKFPSGVYFLRANNNDFQKIIIQH